MSRYGSRVFSTHLSTRENALLASLIGTDSSTLASAVVQLVLVSPGLKDQRSEWEVHGCGVVCFVQDRRLHSAFIRLYSVKRAKLLWEQEVYIPFRYTAPRPYFQIFPGDDCSAGLNFADEEEADKFLFAVQTYVNSYTARPQMLMRTYSLDSTSGRHLWEMREKGHLSSPTDLKPAPASPQSIGMFTASPDVSTEKLSLKVKPALSKSSPSPPGTLPRPKRESLPLAIRKGPLPPLPVHAREASAGTSSERAQILTSGYNPPLPQGVPPPPSHQAPPPPRFGSGLSKSSSLRPFTGRDAFSMVKRLDSSIDPQEEGAETVTLL